MSENSPEVPVDENALIATRRRKMEQIKALGFDPFGQRFDDRQWIDQIRAQSDQIRFVTESGESLPIPSLSGPDAVNLREWKSNEENEVSLLY